MATLYVTLICGNNLPAKDTNGYSDPYCIMKVGTERKKSSVKRRNISPRWNETFQFNVFRPDSDILRIVLMDKDTFSRDDKIGFCTVPLQGLPCNQEKMYTLQLEGKTKWKFKRVRGSLVVKLKAVGFGRKSMGMGMNQMGMGMGMNNMGMGMGMGMNKMKMGMGMKKMKMGMGMNQMGMNQMGMGMQRADGYKPQKVVYTTTTTTFQPNNKFVQFSQQQQPQMMPQQNMNMMNQNNMMMQNQNNMMMQNQGMMPQQQNMMPQQNMMMNQNNMMMQNQGMMPNQQMGMGMGMGMKPQNQNKFMNFYNNGNF